MSWPSETFTPADPSLPSLFFYDYPNQTQEISRIGREQNVDKEMVGLVISKSSRNKQKKLRSDVWKMFEKCKDENGKDLAKCNLCEKLFDGSSKKGTTHLRNHFRSCQNKRNGGGASGSGDKPAGNSVTDQQLNHLDINQFNSYQNKRNEGGASGSGDKPAGNSVTDQQLNHLDRVRTCIKDKNVLSDLGIDNKISSMVTGGDFDLYVLSSDKRENRLSGQGSLISDCKFCVRNFRDIERTCPDFDDEMEEVLYDHIRKILNYIAETSSKTGTFRTAIGRARSLGKEVIAEDIPTEEMLENMSWFELLPIALGLKEAFFELENMDLDFKSINLTKEQWDVITKFDRFCDEENDFDEIDWDSIKTANMYFPLLCRMYKKSLVWVTLDTFISGEIYLPFVRDAEKCWVQSNLILAVAAVLDPRFKLDTVEHWYKKIYGDEWETQRATFKNYLIGVYNEYAESTNNSQSSTSGSKEKKSSISYTMLDISGNSYDPDSGQSNNSELDLYLNWVVFPLFYDFDILEWWQGNSQCFPTLAKMARDFLPIKVTVPFDN